MNEGKLSLDRAVKHDVQVIKLQDFLKVAAIIVDDAGDVVAVETPTRVLSKKRSFRVFRIIPESSTTKLGKSYWSFLDHIGDRIFVLNCSHKQKINFDVFHDKEEQERFYDMIATGFANYSSKRRNNGQFSGVSMSYCDKSHEINEAKGCLMVLRRRRRSINRPSYNTHSYTKHGIYIVKTFGWRDDKIKIIVPRSLMFDTKFFL